MLGVIRSLSGANIGLNMDLLVSSYTMIDICNKLNNLVM